MDRSSDEFFTHTALAADQHRCSRVRHATDLRLDLANRSALAHQFAFDTELVPERLILDGELSLDLELVQPPRPRWRATATENSRSSPSSAFLRVGAIEVDQPEHLVAENDRRTYDAGCLQLGQALSLSKVFVPGHVLGKDCFAG